MLNRADFNPQDFEDIIQQKGYRLLWEQSVNCPCIDPLTGHAVEECPHCDARGHLYFNNNNIKGIITRQNKEMELGDAIGVLEPGEAYLTTSSTNKLSEWDRITNLDSLAVYHETLIHNETGTDQLRYPPIGNVIVAVMQPSRKANLVQLKQNVDYELDANGIISWLTTNKPPNRQGISFRYNYHPVWLVINTPNYVRDTFVTQGNPVDTFSAMPVRVQIRLEQFGEAATS